VIYECNVVTLQGVGDTSLPGIPVLCFVIFQWQYCLKTHCAAEECKRGRGCLTSTARSSWTDGPSPRNPTTPGSDRDRSRGSASVKGQKLPAGTDSNKKSLFPGERYISGPHQCSVWGFKRNKVPRGCFVRGLKGRLEWDYAGHWALTESFHIDLFLHLSSPLFIIKTVVLVFVMSIYITWHSVGI